MKNKTQEYGLETMRRVKLYIATLSILVSLSFAISGNINLYSTDQEDFASIPVDDFTFTARVGGIDNEGDPIILLHGFPETSRMWKDLISLLDENNFQVAAPDQRGYSPGARPRGIDSYKIDLLAKDIMDIADAFGLERFHLAGHDWGSAVGWYIASKYPDRLLTWSALSVPHMDAFIDAMEEDEIQKKKSGYISFFRMSLLPELYFKIFGYRNLKSLWTDSSEDEIDDYIDVFSQRNALKTSLHWYRANLAERGEKIGKINVPTLMISGTNDMAVGETAVDNTQLYINAPYTLKKIDAGHWLIQESFDEVSKYILEHANKNR